MEPWQQNILTAVVSAIIAGIGGWFGHWKWTKQERLRVVLQDQLRRDEHEQKVREAELREQERQAEYEEFKNRRKLVGAGEVEKMERANRLMDLMMKRKQLQIDDNEYDRLRDQLVGGKRSSKVKGEPIDQGMIKEKAASSPANEKHLTTEMLVRIADFDERMTQDQKLHAAKWLLGTLKTLGPHGYPIGYDEDGRKVEWVPNGDISAPGTPHFVSFVMMRSEMEIYLAQEELFRRILWNRHQDWLKALGDDHATLTAEERTLLDEGNGNAAYLEGKYGRANLETTDLRVLVGKLDALRWVTGLDWDSVA